MSIGDTLLLAFKAALFLYLVHFIYMASDFPREQDRLPPFGRLVMSIIMTATLFVWCGHGEVAADRFYGTLFVFVLIGWGLAALVRTLWRKFRRNDAARPRSNR
jgi:hypothetical protein